MAKRWIWEEKDFKAAADCGCVRQTKVVCPRLARVA